MRAWCAPSGGRNCALKKTTCACCARCDSRRASDSKSTRRRKRAIRSIAPRIHAVSRERVRDELTKMLTEGHARRAFELLDETGLLAEVLPEIARHEGRGAAAAISSRGRRVDPHADAARAIAAGMLA